jgi:peptidoglycan/LPS O-acetylase OafA/YrhL
MDSHRSLSLAVLFYVTHIFRMTLFFFVAGFFARLSFHRKGTRAFVADRLLRIGVPLVIALPVINWLIHILTLWGIAVAMPGERYLLPQKALSVTNFPLAHLWFLYFLLLFYAAWLLLRLPYRWLADRWPTLDRIIDQIVRQVALYPYGVAMLALPGAMALLAASRWRLWFGIPTPDRSLIPIGSSVVCFIVAFGFGWLVHRQADLIRAWARHWMAYLAAAVGLTCAAMAIVGLTPVTLMGVSPTRKLLYAACYVLATWAWTFGLIGAATRFMAEQSPARRYVADASYWLYLAHLPVLVTLQVILSPLDWPWAVKFVVILVVAFAVLLLSYQYLVRYTIIGTVLNGQRLLRPARELDRYGVEEAS